MPVEKDDVESIYAIWHDPLSYDHMKYMPPYLPGKGSFSATASSNKIDRKVSAPLIQKHAETFGDDIATLLTHMLKDYQGATMAELAAVLIYERALSFVFWTHHWQTNGATFYADHLLFERLYNDTVPMIDQIAERVVGSSAPDLVNPVIQSVHTAVIIKQLYSPMPAQMTPDTYVAVSLKGTLHFLTLVKIATKLLQDKNQLSQGTDNLLADIADKHEEFVYLLKQRTGAVKASYQR